MKKNSVFKSVIVVLFILVLAILIFTVFEYVNYQENTNNSRDKSQEIINDFTNKYNGFVKMLKLIIEQNTENKSKISSLSTQDSNISQNLKKMNQSVDYNIQKLNIDISNQARDLNLLKGDLNNLDTKINNSKKIQLKIQDLRQNNTQLLNDIMTTFSEITDTNSSIWDAITQLYERYLTATDDVKVLNNKITTNQNDKKELLQKRLQFRNRMNEYIKEISDINNNISEINLNINTQNERFDDIQDKINFNNTSISALYQNYNENLNDITTLKNNLDSYVQQRENISERLASIQDSFTTDDNININQKLLNIKKLLNEVQIFIDVCKDAIQIIESSNVIILQDINTIQSKIDNVRSKINTLNNRYNNFDTKINNFNSSNQNLETSLNNISDINEDVNNTIDLLTAKYSSLEQNIDSVQQNTGNNDSYVKNIDNNLKTLFNFRQNGNIITDSLQDQSFEESESSPFDFKSHATAMNSMRISTGNKLNDDKNLKICKKESDNICVQFAMDFDGLHVIPQNVSEFIINDRDNNGIAKFDMENHAIMMGGTDESAALRIYNDIAFANIKNFEK